jgi:cell division protein FtsB
MATRQYKPARYKSFILPVLTLACLGYFVVNGIYGKSGVAALKEAQAKEARLQQELDNIVKKREIVENRVILLGNGSLEKDMLDERARYLANMIHPDDVVILRPR